MAGGMTERTPGVWDLRVNLGRDPVTGKRRTKSLTFRGSKRAASKALAALVTQVDSGAHRGTDQTVAFLLRRYLEHMDGELSPSTLVHYRRRVESRLIPALGGIRLRKLTAGHLATLYDSLKAAGRRPSDIRQYNAIMRGALRCAVEWEWVDKNVAERARLPRAGGTEIHPPDTEFILDVIDLAERGTGHPRSKPNPAFACYLRVVAATGCRRGEACGLQWADFDDGMVTIRRNVVDGLGRGVPPVIKPTKTHTVRGVALDEGTAESLAAHAQRVQAEAKDAGVTVTKDAFVFSSEPDGSLPWRPEYATLAFRRIAARLGRPDVRLHDFRHAHLSLLFDSGLPLHAIQRRAGHRAASTTMNIYGHGRPERDPEAAAIAGRALERGLQR